MDEPAEPATRLEVLQRKLDDLEKGYYKIRKDCFDRREPGEFAAYSVLQTDVEKAIEVARGCIKAAKQNTNEDKVEALWNPAKDSVSKIRRSIDVFGVSKPLLSIIYSERTFFEGNRPFVHGGRDMVRFKSTYILADDLLRVVVETLDYMENAVDKIVLAHYVHDTGCDYELKEDEKYFKNELDFVTQFRKESWTEILPKLKENRAVCSKRKEKDDQKVGREMHRLHKLLLGKREKLEKAGLVGGGFLKGLSHGFRSLLSGHYAMQPRYLKTNINVRKITELDTRVAQKVESKHSIRPYSTATIWLDVRESQNRADGTSL